MSGRRSVEVLIALSLAWLPLAYGQEAARNGNDEEDRHIQIINADNLKWENEPQIVHLWGNVILGHKDVRLYCDEAWVDEKNDTARCLGHLKVTDPATEIVGDLITADFTQEVVTIVNNVRLRHQKTEENEAETGETEPPIADEATGNEESPPNASGNAEDEEPETFRDYEKKLTTVTCERIDYYYEQERAVARGSVVAKQENKTVYADRAVYDEKNEIITLEGGEVRVETEEGDLIKCVGAIVDLDQDIIQATKITGIIHREERKAEPEPVAGGG